MEIAIVFWLICIIVASSIGSKKGEGLGGFLFGVLLGPIGVILALLSSGNRKPCKFCKELMHKDAVVCPHCQKELSS